MTLPGIEPRSPGPLANTLLIRPMVPHCYNIVVVKNFEFSLVVSILKLLVLIKSAILIICE